MKLTALTFAEREMTISSWPPPSHVANGIVWPELVSRIEVAADGRVTERSNVGLHHPVAS